MGAAHVGQYNGANHAQTILEVNDILQGRSELSFDMLYSILKQKCGEDMKIPSFLAYWSCCRVCEKGRKMRLKLRRISDKEILVAGLGIVL